MNNVKNLIRNSISSSFFILIGLGVSAQLSTKRYIKKNKNTESVQYGDSSIYARGLLFMDDRLFLGNSDGSIYYMNPKSKESQLIFKKKKINEIRDIDVSGNKIIAMHSGENGKIILLGVEGNIHILALEIWEGVFLDGMDFIGDRGFMMGDPTQGAFNLFHTNDSGNSWDKCKGNILATPGEAGFAASGTNVQILNDSTYMFVSGGLKSRFFKSTNNGKTWSNVYLPYYSSESTGAYSMHFMNDSIGVIVGGDYLSPELKNNVSFYTEDGGKTWLNPINPVGGYRSCVFSKDNVYYSSGRNGIDFSLDGGKNWTAFAQGSYFSLNATETHLIATTKFGSIQFFELIKR